MLDHRIETFLTLYTEMNYRKTAEMLNMTQPGVTQHIHYLESHYGTKLFVYNGRTLHRTHSADLLKRYLDSVRAEELDLLHSFAPDDRVQLKIGATKTIGEFVICDRIKHFLSCPLHSLEFTVDNTETLLHMLEKAQIDFAIIEGVFDKSKYGYHLYKEEEFVGICAKTHPFAGKTVSLEDAFRESILVREQGSGTRKLLEQAISDRGFSLQSFFRCSSISNFSLICELVASTDAITFAYTPIAQSRTDLACFALKDIQIKGEFNYVYCNERIARQKIDRFLI